ncbi:MAG: ORF6N domain-containing protein [Chitinophagaceae bacterium]|nr:ORF6N domain-containing protein [Chitinophagaceae bacterium]
MRLTVIQQKIYEIRGYRVMLDFDLAALYGTETRTLKQTVRRNIDRFPKDFMFQLTKKEWKEVITICDNLPATVKFSPALPYAFSEHGVTMLASVLKSKKAIKMNIAIVRAFIALKQFVLNYKDLASQIKEIRHNVANHSEQLNQIYDAIENMMDEKEEKKQEKRLWKERERIGFKK